MELTSKLCHLRLKVDAEAVRQSVQVVEVANDLGRAYHLFINPAVPAQGVHIGAGALGGRQGQLFGPLAQGFVFGVQ